MLAVPVNVSLWDVTSSHPNNLTTSIPFILPEEYTTSQLHRRSSVEVNKFLLAYVILFERVYFRHYFSLPVPIADELAKRVISEVFY